MLGFGAVGQFAIGDVAITSPSAVPDEATWHQGWSNPVRQAIAPSLAIALIASGSFALTVPSPQPVFFPSGWSQPPARVIRTQYQSLTTSLQPFVSFSWFNELSPSSKSKTSIVTGAQEFFEFQPTPIVNIGWFNQFSTPPVLAKPRLPESEQRFFTESLIPIVSFSWFKTLSEPVRVKQRLETGAQPVLFFNTSPIVSFGWNYDFNQPVRIKPGLNADKQQFLALVQAVFGETISADKWFAQLSLPVRIKPQLLAGLQQPLQHVISPITLYLQATESPDVMAFTIATFEELTGAEVSIVEIFPVYANVSSAYVNRVYCDVGIVEISS